MSHFPPLRVEFVRVCVIGTRTYDVGDVAAFEYDLATALMGAGFVVPEGCEPAPPPPRNWVTRLH